MAITLSDTFSDNLLGHGGIPVADQIGGGSLVAYASGGSPPAGPNEAHNGTVIATWTFSDATLQGSASAGSMSLAFAAQTVSATGSGTADYFRVLNSSSAALIQGTIGTAAPADWVITNASFTSGDQFAITGTATISWADS